MSDTPSFPPPMPSVSAPPEARSRKPLWIIIGGVGAILAIGTVGAVAISGGGDVKEEIAGSFTLIDTDGVLGDWDGCYGDGGYDDFGAGMNITIRNSEGTIVGSGETRGLSEADAEGDGNLAEAARTAQDIDDITCTVTFTVPVDRSDFYDVEIGRRGTMSYSREELNDADWWIETSLGSFDD